MVYWGCGTARNRCAWAACAALAAAATVLLCVGAAQMWVCNHRPTAPAAAAAAGGGAAGPSIQQELQSCRVKAGIIMALCPVLVILGLLPSLLFFQSCMAVPPPQPVDWEKGVPSSSITVVRRTTNGAAAVYRYDAHGKLLNAPDCYRHMPRTPPSPAKLGPVTSGPFQWSHPGDTLGPHLSTAQHGSSGVLGQGFGGPGSPNGLASPGRGPAGQLTLGPLTSNSSSSGSAAGLGSRGQCSPQYGLQQYSPQCRQYSPHGQQYSPQSGRYSGQGGSGEEGPPAAEVFISLSPLKEGAAGRK